MTLDPEGNLWFSNVTRFDTSDGFTYSCAATSVFRLNQNSNFYLNYDKNSIFN